MIALRPMEELQGQVLNAVLAVMGAVLSWVAVSARSYFQQKVENEYVEGLLLRLTDAVEVGVRDTAATLVPNVKAIAEDGKISAEEAVSLKESAKNAALDQLTRVDRSNLGDLFDQQQFERKLDKLIEAAVQRLKEGR